ncbi:hypothetical protein B0H21DRAFT_864312 [Amylocystis lapponica]|nr:hypothetical protein B0H21DRAFT_864312 [Amylocystis lapponica]
MDHQLPRHVQPGEEHSDSASYLTAPEHINEEPFDTAPNYYQDYWTGHRGRPAREVTEDASTPAFTMGRVSPGASSSLEPPATPGQDESLLLRDAEVEALEIASPRVRDWLRGELSYVSNQSSDSLRDGELNVLQCQFAAQRENVGNANEAVFPEEENGKADEQQNIEDISFNNSRSADTVKTSREEKGKARAVGPELQAESQQEGSQTNNNPRVISHNGDRSSVRAASSSLEWAEGNELLLTNWARLQEQLDPPENAHISIDNNMPTQFIHGFMKMLTSRGGTPGYREGVIDPYEQRGEALLGNFAKIKEHAMHYLSDHHNIPREQIEANVPILLMMMANNFYESHMYLMDKICEQAIQNWQARPNDVILRFQDFAFGAEIFFDYFPPGGSEHFTRIHDTIEERHRLRPPKKTQAAQSTTTSSGRQSVHTKQYMANLEAQEDKIFKQKIQQHKEAQGLATAKSTKTKKGPEARAAPASSQPSPESGGNTGPVKHCSACGQPVPPPPMPTPTPTASSTWYISPSLVNARSSRQIPEGLPRERFKLVSHAPPSAEQIEELVDVISQETAPSATNGDRSRTSAQHNSGRHASSAMTNEPGPFGEHANSTGSMSGLAERPSASGIAGRRGSFPQSFADRSASPVRRSQQVGSSGYIPPIRIPPLRFRDVRSTGVASSSSQQGMSLQSSQSPSMYRFPPMPPPLDVPVLPEIGPSPAGAHAGLTFTFAGPETSGASSASMTHPHETRVGEQFRFHGQPVSLLGRRASESVGSMGQHAAALPQEQQASGSRAVKATKHKKRKVEERE